jgi:glycosyltransferase involved in cell wall biosynthesis
MKKKILICLDRLKYPYSGLGRVSEDFSTAIQNNTTFDYYYLVPDGVYHFLPKKKTIRFSLLKRISSHYMRKFDLVHIPHQLPSYPINQAKKKVITIHDLNFLYTKNESKRQKYKTKVERIIKQADAIVFISKFTQQDCYKNLAIPSGITTKVIYNGVSDLLPPSEKPLWCPDSSFLFSIGVMLDKKNFHVLLPFIKQLPKHIKLIIAGDKNTKYGQDIQSQINDLALTDRVILPGTITEAQKSYLYHHCDAFVFPSIAEGFGLPVIEAMLAGKAVFCSNKTSLYEIGAQFAYFWDHFDPIYMAEVFNKGLKHFNADENRKQNQMVYAKTFTWEKNANDYMHLYNELLNE